MYSLVHRLYFVHRYQPLDIMTTPRVHAHVLNDATYRAHKQAELTEYFHRVIKFGTLDDSGTFTAEEALVHSVSQLGGNKYMPDQWKWYAPCVFADGAAFDVYRGKSDPPTNALLLEFDARTADEPEIADVQLTEQLPPCWYSRDTAQWHL
jgi:hypothetical protein